MAGHSKWANIKHRKERADAAKGKIFTRHAKEIISAVKVGGPDPKANPRLRLAIQKAKSVNMPNENIERNIKRGASTDQADYESVTYDIYGYAGVGILVEAMTDNKNRSASDIRTVLGKKGGTLATPGAVSFNFDKRGIIQLTGKDITEERLFEAAIEAGALDFEAAPEGNFVITEPSNLYEVKEKLEKIGMGTEGADIEMVPRHLVSCGGDDLVWNKALIEALENLDDVNAVYHNMEMTEE